MGEGGQDVLLTAMLLLVPSIIAWYTHRHSCPVPYLGRPAIRCYFQSPDMPTKPRETIQEITSSHPSDPKSPFFGMEMKPLARVYLTRQRLYEKSCSDDTPGGATDDDLGSNEHVASGGMSFIVMRSCMASAPE